MKKNKVPGILYAIPLIFILLIPGSCKKDPSLMPYDSLLMDINRFIWKGLNYNYLWYKDSYNLTDTRFSDNSERDDFLSEFSDPEALFYSLLYDYGSVDRFSWIVDDYVALEEYFQGISLSMGFKYKILYYSGNNVIGSVLYVVDGSPADNAGIKRGDLFSHINGSRLTGSNYGNLLDNYNYTLTIAEIDGDQVNTLKNVSLTVAEVVENPVYFSNIYTVNNKKTGYLFYKGFRRNYEEDLNNVFGYFASEGIDELVLDLRYNGGGYVSTCARLGSMIYEADTNKIFCIKEYNDKYGQWLVDEYGPDAKNFNFYYSVFQEDNSIIPINSLGLDNIYVLTTGSSASASELLINCLRAYIDVTIIGTKTYGKNVGSITVYDTDDDGNINPDHLWAMQPIVSKSYNVNYSSPYSDGFDPDYLLEEDYLKLLPIGDENEAMLKYALDLIAGTPVDNKAAYSHNYNIIADSQDKDPYWSEMIVDPGK
jgi:C-terminal processing protease CtpA/Prc